MSDMIRINLLPTRDAPKRQAAAVQLVAFVVLLVVVGAFILAIDIWQNDRVQAQTRANSVVEDRIERIRRQISDHDEIRERIEEIESKQEVIEQLQAGRTGPTFVLVELASILSRNGSPTVDHDRYMELVRRSPGQAYDPNWDGRRLWLQEFREEAREVELTGIALSHEDVAELLRRLTLSDFFHRVTLVTTRSQDRNEESTVFAPSMVDFEIRCQLRYGGLPTETPEAGGTGGQAPTPAPQTGA